MDNFPVSSSHPVRRGRLIDLLRAAIALFSVVLLATAAPAHAGLSVSPKFSIATGWAASGAASDGTHLLVALESDTQTARVASQLVAPSSGTPVGPVIPLGHDGQSCCTAGIAFDGTNYLVVWEEDQGIKDSPAPFLVFGQFIGPSGTKIGSAIAMSSPGIWFDGLKMLAFGGGKYLLTYTRLIDPAKGDNSTNRYVAGRIVSPDGTLGNEFRISQGYGNGSSVIFDGTNFFVVWKEDSLDYEVRGRQVAPTGTLGQEISINASAAASDFPVAAAFDGTNYMVVWTDNAGSGGDVLAQRVSSAGTLVGGPITVTSEAGHQFATGIVFDGTGFIVSWTDMKNDANANGLCDQGEGTCWDVYAQVIDTGGVPSGGKVAISTEAGNQFGGIGCGSGHSGQCLALVSSGVAFGRGGPSQVGSVSGAFLTSSLVGITFAPGWNLAGNGTTGSVSVTTLFGDTNKVQTVWKWVPATSRWAFYAPSLVGQQLTDYANGKGYDLLATIQSGEGFWVNAKIEFSIQLPVPGLVNSVAYQDPVSGTGRLLTGWNLIAIGDNKTPSEFNKALSVTPPAQGEIPINLTTLWAWSANGAMWYFYAPSLDANGTLASYAANKGYLQFGSVALSRTTGFWVNKPSPPN